MVNDVNNTLPKFYATIYHSSVIKKYNKKKVHSTSTLVPRVIECC